MVAASFFYGSRVPERLGNRYGEVIWGLLLVLLGVLDSRGQEGPIGIGTGAQVGYGFQHFWFTERGTRNFERSSRRRGSTG